MDVGTIVSGISLILKTLHKIITLVNEVIQFKKECLELGAISATLKIAIEKNQGALTNHSSLIKLQACLTDIEVLIRQCTQKWNLLKHAREVFFDHKLLQLRQNLLAWVAAFTLESSVRTWKYVCYADIRPHESIL
jgi:hypothetical protein